MEKNPEIAEAWLIYDSCRKRELVRIEKSRGTGKNQVTEVSLIPRTEGYSQLPWEGGMMDQPYRLFVFFDAFMHGEAEAFAEKVR